MNQIIIFCLLATYNVLGVASRKQLHLLPQKWTDDGSISEGEDDINEMFQEFQEIMKGWLLQEKFLESLLLNHSILLVKINILYLTGTARENPMNQLQTTETLESILGTHPIQVLSNSGKKQSVVKPFVIEDIYFHNEEQDFSIRLYKMEGFSKLDFKIVQLRTNLPERRVDMQLLLPKLNVEGFYTADRMAYNDYTSKASGYFWLTLGNVTADGLALLRLENNSTFKVDRMRLSYTPKSKKLQISQQERNERLSVFINSLSFGKTILQKIWRDVTYNLNKVVQDKVNPVIKEKSLKLLIRDKDKFAKYTDYVVTSTESANELLDTMVDYAKTVIEEKHNGKMKIPNIKEGFERKVLFVTWKGEFNADQGTARGLTTVQRMGDTVFANDNNSMMHFYGTLGFENIELFYDHFKASFMGLGPSGSFGTKFYPLDLYVHCHINFTGRRVFLDDFRVMKVGEMEVKLKGWGWLLDFLATKLATWMGGLFRDKIVYDLQNRYDLYISDLLGNYDLDDILEGKFR